MGREQAQLQHMQQMHALAQAALETAGIDAASPEGNPPAYEEHAAVRTTQSNARQRNHAAHGKLEQSAQLALQAADENALVPATCNAAKAEGPATSVTAEAKPVALPDAEGSGAACK